MPSAHIVRETNAFVTTLLNKSLPANMCFHNLHHTCYVAHAALEIGFYTGISVDDMIVLQTAALLHDTGYCYSYSGHEEDSIAIAATFLKQQECDNEFIDAVSACIAATKVPQSPVSVLQQIICDADMYHLSDEEYPAISAKLKEEWELKLGRTHTNEEWKEDSIKLLTRHHYFTDYGKSVLQTYKERNISKLLAQ